MFKGTLLDIDGILVDSEQLYRRAVNETFAHYKVPEMSVDEYVRRYMIEGTNSPGVIADYGLDVSLEEVRERKAKIVERMIQQELKMIDGAAELLECTRKLRRGAVTSADENEMYAKLNRFGLTLSFDALVFSEMTERHKPDPEPYAKGAELLQLPPGEIFVVEDNPSGVESANAAGCISIAYPNGFTADMKMDFSHAHKIVTDLRQINDSMLAKLYRRTHFSSR
ncbi:MAG: HAD family phosphatase [Candidatus Aenigmarchaeota archaeon]|nr:HAD family phosphatase [Candidatus Aenigmarchaeota archaeon]